MIAGKGLEVIEEPSRRVQIVVTEDGKVKHRSVSRRQSTIRDGVAQGARYRGVERKRRLAGVRRCRDSPPGSAVVACSRISYLAALGMMHAW